MRSEDRPDQAELFSAMPPLEAFKVMVTIFVGRVNDAYHDGDAGRSFTSCTTSRGRTSMVM
eukprot:7812907-Pyramimonas_sp.AAC.1